MTCRSTNSFMAPQAVDHVIAGEEGTKLGTLRVKPVGIGWKPANARQFHSVGLDRLIAWITDKEASSSRLTKT